MTVNDAVRITRTNRTLPVPEFRRIELRDPANWAELVVEPSSTSFVEVEGPADVIGRVQAEVDGELLRITLGGGLLARVSDALTTSLTRAHVSYRVRAPRVDEVRVLGLVHVSVDAFGADAPVVTRLHPVPPVAAAPPGVARPPTTSTGPR